MGANDKHAATYHGGEYTPKANDIREVWGGFSEYGGLVIRPSGTPNFLDDRYAEFDRWLETVRAEAKREALEEAAKDVRASEFWITPMHNAAKEIRFWLRTRANQYKENQS